MHGTKSQAAFDSFVAAGRLFPITSDADLNEAIGLLKAAQKSDDTYARPKGWLAYAYGLSLWEGWRIDATRHPEEAGWDRDALAARAVALADEARALDEEDYDTWWAVALVQLYTGKTSDSVATYEEAIRRARDEANPHLLVEMADALTFDGQIDRAIDLCLRARRVEDWHRHQLAFCYYMKARTDSGLYFYDQALGEIAAMHRSAGDKGYPALALLAAAATHAQKATRLRARGDQSAADAEQAAADVALARFRASPGFANYSLADAGRSAAFRGPTDLAHWLDGCALAGLK